MKLAIIGSTKFTHPEALNIARQLILHKLEIFTPEIVISGGAKGIDQLGVEMAKEMEIETLVFSPQTLRWRPDDGTVGFESRNMLIVEYCTHLLAIRDHKRSKNNGWSKHNTDSTYGSGWTADYAQNLGLKVERIVL